MSQDHPRIVSIGGVAFDARRFISAYASARMTEDGRVRPDEAEIGVYVEVDACSESSVFFVSGEDGGTVDEVAKAVREALEA